MPQPDQIIIKGANNMAKYIHIDHTDTIRNGVRVCWAYSGRNNVYRGNRSKCPTLALVDQQGVRREFTCVNQFPLEKLGLDFYIVVDEDKGPRFVAKELVDKTRR